MRLTLLSFCLLIGFLLASCGGTSNPYVSHTPVSTSSYAASAFYGDAMGAEVLAFSITSTSNMPSGSFTYNGYAGFGDGAISSYSDLGLVGNLTLNANFSNGTYSGSITNFYNTSGSLSGTANMSGTISGNTLSGNTSGSLSQAGWLGGSTVTNSGTMIGVFADNGSSNATAVLGTMIGTSGSDSYSGLFVGKR